MYVTASPVFSDRVASTTRAQFLSSIQCPPAHTHSLPFPLQPLNVSMQLLMRAWTHAAGPPARPRARLSCFLHNPSSSSYPLLLTGACSGWLQFPLVRFHASQRAQKATAAQRSTHCHFLRSFQIGAAACKKPSRRGPRAVMGGMMSTYGCRFSDQGAMRDRGSRTATSLQERGSSPLLLHLCSHAILRW